tara:strand:+ start:83 stop:772 length:690 start_codon:yes stop_codon:yes gene_type:complete
MTFFRLFLIFVVQLVLARSEEKNIEPKELYRLLEASKGWVMNDEIEGYKLFSKKIEDQELSAVMVTYETSIPLLGIQEVLMDVENYESFLSSSSKMVTKQLKKDESAVIGYQFIPINFPFMSDRHYCFKLIKNEINAENSKTLVKWFLLDEDKELLDVQSSNNTNPIYLKYGAGLWLVDSNDESKVKISYRLFMDPGGSIPNFLTEKINETSIINLFKDVIAEAERRTS